MKQLTASFLLMLTVVFLLSSCKDDSYNLGQEFTLKFGKSAIINRNGSTMRIEFEKLVQESRCRPGVQCFWAGNVDIRLKINSGSQYTLTYSADSIPQVVHDNSKITLLDVSYGKDKNYAKEKKYTVKLRVD